MAEITITGLNKIYPNGTVALQDINIAVADGEFLVLVGPSGCGKSTVLRCVAGLEQPTSGTIAVGGRQINDLPPQARDVAMAFENYALYPTLAVQDNIEFPLKIRRWPRSRIDEKVEWVAGAVQITDILHRRPFELSGGQQQRVSLARAIVREPKAFLFDEPYNLKAH